MYYCKDIIMTGYAAGYGAAVIARCFNSELAKRLPSSIINRVLEYHGEQRLHLNPRTMDKYADYIWQVSEGGIFKALRDMADSAGTGILVWLDRINIRQEAIEICEIYDINPYMLNGTGTTLIISGHGNELVRELENEGIHASVIGCTMNNNDKVIINGNEMRYLESRITDELYKPGIKEYVSCFD